jgi:hypothetical protein
MPILSPPGLSAANARILAEQALRPYLECSVLRSSAFDGALSDGTQTSFGQRLILQLGTQCGWLGIRFLFANWNQGTQNDGANDLTIKLGLEFPSGTFRPIFWESGGRTKTLAPGERAWTSPIELEMVGGAAPRLLYYVTVPTGGKWPTIPVKNAAAQYFESPATDKTDGQSAFAGASTVNVALPPISIQARPSTRYTAAGQPVVAVVYNGDSIFAGQGDTDSGQGYMGYAARGLFAAGIPSTRRAQGGMLASEWGTEARRLKWFTGIGGCTHMLCDLGTNDITAAVSLSTLQASHQTIAAAATFRGIKYVPCTLLPRTDAANTTARSGDTAALIQLRADFNAWIRTNPFGNGYFDADAVARDAGNPNLWRTDLGTPTADGLHPATVVHTALGTALAAAAPTLFR